ncbi:hypothetical protein ASE35_05760 [Lysobacter sp. Root916]|uniref:hypothetical protein n=1 Tax=Lysobacter sp. Root916 TaxID=1736606 RepID=UPI00070B0C46|nr:hypothetical protein [Lysobacter sp. Root916]KRD39826.1 hypothetical protein ASE35_05760 [Lysobacter sp. Root916]
MKGSSNEITLPPSLLTVSCCWVGWVSSSSIGSSIQKWLPPPGFSSSPISPPSSWVRVRAMVVPKPVPPKRRVGPVSTCSKAWKMRSASWLGTPMPVSRTEKRSHTRRSESPLSARSPARRATSDTPPFSVNLTALCIRFNSTWVSNALSPLRRTGTSSSMSTLKVRPLAEASGCSIFCRRLSTSCRLKSTSRRCSLPASIAEMSSTSLTSNSSDCAEVWMTSAYSRCSGARRVPCMSSAMPMMPFKGVRSSWLILARKRLLASLARRASSVAFCRLRSSEDR